MIEENPNTKLRELLQTQDRGYMEFKFKDNEKAHEIINDIITKLIERVNHIETYIQESVEKRLENIEKFVTTELIGPSSLQYKPPGNDDYIGLGGNLDLIYERLNNLEKQIFDQGK
ncbi:spike glycoprotein [Synechococcus phage S-CREM1]|nr:spike glycoprotein [Synechococcus phage S-CREM1]